MDKDKVKLEALDYAFENECVSKDVISAYIYGYSSGVIKKENDEIIHGYKKHELLSILRDDFTKFPRRYNQSEMRVMEILNELISILRQQDI